MNYMLDFYTNSVRFGYMEIEQVPERYQADVKAALGLD